MGEMEQKKITRPSESHPSLGAFQKKEIEFGGLLVN